MSKLVRRGLQWAAGTLVLVLALAEPARAADTLNWRTNQNRVSADIKGWELPRLLSEVASVTGWRVYLEPETTHTVSAKFADLPVGEALSRLLGDLNFAVLPETNASSRMFVFRTLMQNATVAIRPVASSQLARAQPKIVPNELIVRLKPGAKIEELARLLGAKVIGQIPGQNAYRLQFNDSQATEAGREQLSSNSDVASVDNNYYIDRPDTAAAVASGNLPPPPSLQLRPPPDNGRVVVGLVDTAVQPLGNNLDQFLLKQLSVAGDAQLDPNSPAHGTSMAETILRGLQAITKGSTSVQILPVDVYGANASTTTFDVANGIVQAVNGGAKIVNLSLGSDGDSPFLHDIIKNASSQNILFVGAAGNQPVTTPFYPAAYPEVNAVTAVDQGQLAPYANRGSFVSLGAPGTSVIYFNGQPYVVTGTSGSSALVSGAVAGFQERTHGTTANAQTFLRSAFGFQSGSGK